MSCERNRASGPPPAPKKLLIIKPSALGDIVHSLPFLHSLKSRYPEVEVHWVIARGLHELLEDHPLIQRLWVIDKDEWKKASKLGRTVMALARLRAGLSREGFDTTVDLQGLLRSGVICSFTGSRLRIGFDEAREGSRYFYNCRIRGGKEIHAVERYLKIAAFLGCDTREIRFPFPPFATSSPLLRGLPEKYVIMAPSAGGEAKRWPAERFGELASRLSLPSLIVSGKADAQIAEEAARASGGKAVSLGGRTSLKELVSIIRKARLLISNDTGPMHIAAAFSVPVLALLGPTNPARTGPYGSLHTVIRADSACSPCYRRKPCGHWDCMTSISVDQVFEIATKHLGGD